jgi:APA family basic amino acid/polyamine antiporter
VQNVFTSAKILALASLIVLVLALGRNPAAVSANLRGVWDAAWNSRPVSGGVLLAAVGVAMVGSLFSADAWNNITFTAGEVSEPHRNIPLSLVLGTAAVTGLYVLANVAYLAALPVLGSPEGADVMGRGIQFAVNDRVATAAVSFFGAKAEMLLALLIMVSTFGCNNGLILAGARVTYAMAEDGLFFKRTGELNENAVPGAALKLQALWAGALCLSGTYGDLLDYVIFAVLIFYVLTVIGLFILRKKRPEAPRPYKAWGYPWLPGSYVLAATAVCLDLLVFKPKYTWPGVVIVLLGIPVYLVWNRHRTLGLDIPRP